MTHEKELLLKDLSERIVYGVKVCIDRDGYDVGRLNCIERFVTDDGDEYWAATVGFYRGVDIERIKPYLRPMSSMTFEETREFLSTESGECKEHFLTTGKQDWLNSHYFDYRGLIEMGLALEAPEGMYK